jgi:hypothetical protein
VWAVEFRRLWWAAYEAGMGKEKCIQNTEYGGETFEKLSDQRPGKRWMDNIKIHPKATGRRNGRWIEIDQEGLHHCLRHHRC